MANQLHRRHVKLSSSVKLDDLCIHTNLPYLVQAQQPTHFGMEISFVELG